MATVPTMPATPATAAGAGYMYSRSTVNAMYVQCMQLLQQACAPGPLTDTPGGIMMHAGALEPTNYVYQVHYSRKLLSNTC